MNASSNQIESRWPHGLAVCLAVATFPLIWLGGLVTTYDAGMAVPDWPTTFGYNPFLYPLQTWLSGPFEVFIEHGHRLLGAAVGLLAIALCWALWRCESRPWVRWMGLAALVMVILQGVLGGMRVLFDERVLALIHGCLGPAFFALCAALAVLTSASWRSGRAAKSTELRPLARLALVTTALAYLQLVVGALVRHGAMLFDPSLFRVAVWFHLFLAAALAVHAVLLGLRVPRERCLTSGVRAAAVSLAVLVLFQIGLGVGTWLVNYGVPAWARQGVLGRLGGESFVVVQRSSAQALVTTAHVAVGSLILVAALALTLRVWRLAAEPLRLGAQTPVQGALV